VKREFELVVGRTEIPAVQWGPSSADIAFINLHQDEQTSIAAARQLLDGRATLMHFATDPERCLRFISAGRTLKFDPNRMFSALGAQRSLEHHNGDAPERAVAEISQLGEAVLRQLLAGKPRRVVAVHNTDEEYSIRSFIEGSPEAGSAAAVHIVPSEARHDFFLVTREKCFQFLAQAGFNVVLQASGLEDDGSLSLYCARAGIDYINAEAHPDHEARQVEMLQKAMQAPWACS